MSQGKAFRVFAWTGITLEIAAVAGAAYFTVLAMPDLLRYLQIRRI